MKILVAYDDSSPAKDALIEAQRYAKFLNGKVYLVSCCLVTGENKQLKEVERIEEDLAEAKKDFENDGISCETHMLVQGMNAGEALVQFSREKGVKLIIVGVRRRSKVGKLVFGSTAQYVILKTDCPVLCIK